MVFIFGMIFLYLLHNGTKTKYKFNPESLSFDKIRLGVREVLLRTLAYIIGSVIIAVIYSFISPCLSIPRKKKRLNGK